MQSRSDISVIICCYNSNLEDLKNTLCSILNQKNVSFDVVISDDGSKNKEFLCIRQWIKQNKINNVYINSNEENLGTVRNIYSALKYCKSEFVKLISPGDFLYDEFVLRKYFDIFETTGATVVGGEAVYFNKNNEIIPCYYPKLRQSLNPKFYKRNFIAYGDNVLGATLAYKKDFLVGELPEISQYFVLLEDMPLLAKCLLSNKKMVIKDEPLVWYEYGTGVSTSVNSNPLFEKDIENYYVYLAKFNKNESNFRIKLQKMNKKWSFLKKAFLYPIIMPGYTFFRIKCKLSKGKRFCNSLDKKKEIVTYVKELK